MIERSLVMGDAVISDGMRLMHSSWRQMVLRKAFSSRSLTFAGSSPVGTALGSRA